MWSSVEEQIALYDGFAAELKASTKEMKAIIRQFHKPPKATKKAKTAASEGEKKRGRKKKEVVEEQDPMLALNERLIAAAQSDEPIVQIPEFVRAPKQPNSHKEQEQEQEIKTPEPPTEEELAMPAKPERPIKKKVVVAPDEKLAKAEAKEAAKAANDAAKAAEKAEKEAAKAAEKAEKEAAKAAEKAEKEAAKAAEKAEKEAAKAAAKKPVKEKESKKKVEPVVLPIPELKRNSPTNDNNNQDEEEEELECEIFKLDGVEYLIDSANTVYDRNTQDIIGTYDSANKKINKY
jgi:colicin import membrane protein